MDQPRPTPQESVEHFREMIEMVATTAPLFRCPVGHHFISKPWIPYEDEYEIGLICPDCKAEYHSPKPRPIETK